MSTAQCRPGRTVQQDPGDKIARPISQRSGLQSRTGEEERLVNLFKELLLVDGTAVSRTPVQQIQLSGMSEATTTINQSRRLGFYKNLSSNPDPSHNDGSDTGNDSIQRVM